MSNHSPNGRSPQILLGYRRKSVVRQASDEVSLEAQTDYCRQWLSRADTTSLSNGMKI
jgi:hypothetical protein